MKSPTPFAVVLSVACALLLTRDCAESARATSTAMVGDQKVCTGSAASGGGTFTCDYPTTTDRASILVARVGLSTASAAHLAGAGALWCEYVVENRNGTVTATTALASSNNPANNNTTTFVAAHAQALDSAFVSGGPSGCAWSISGTNARLTVTDLGGTTADVTVWIQAFNFGSQ